jgi:aerobic-type carbon monoxide dehydrogenase small subunit (CoxS/CutS family)
MLMAAAQLLDHSPNPDLAEIREGLAGNLCRCTGFIRIFESVAAATSIGSAGPATTLTTEQSSHAR